MHPYLSIAKRAAEEAGKIIQRGHRDLEKLQVVEKGRGDFVSNIDRQAEETIRSIIKEKFPNHKLVGEEYGEEELDSPHQWIIDPLDGTSNFLHGQKHCAVSIAYAKNGVLETGIIFNPLTQDIFTASKGEGAIFNGRKIRCNNQKDPKAAIVVNGYKARFPDEAAIQVQISGKVLAVFGDLRRSGSAALDCAYTACGFYDAYYEKGPHSWDIAAGILIAQEAGCLVSDFVGGKDMFKREEIVISNPNLHPVLLDLIKED